MQLAASDEKFCGSWLMLNQFTAGKSDLSEKKEKGQHLRC